MPVVSSQGKVAHPTHHNTCDSVLTSEMYTALEIPRQPQPQSLQDRWYSEPVRILVFPRTSFLRNAKGYPVFAKAHQQYLTQMMRLRFPPWILLSEADSFDAQEDQATAAPTPAEAASSKPKDPIAHLRYLRHLQQTQPARSTIDSFGQGYQDYMQSPLQPLTDNLESITYEVFEKDPVKYDWYERAVALALKDLSAKLGKDKEIVIAVVGAGRGPLVSKVLLASRSSGVKVEAWAIEKNQNAYVHLQRRNQIDPLWNKEVTVVKTDMRAWKGPLIAGETRKVDILVSELLGSFADNELSPECLDGVQHVLDSQHGINIPQSYSAHMTPISTPRLHADLLGRSGTDKWEIPVVVMFQQHDYLSTQAESADLRTPDVRDAWSFSHPISSNILDQAEARRGGSAEFGGAGGAVGGDGSNEHNYRYCKVSFPCQQRGTCHGLAGYFESVLYASHGGEKVELSTNPVTMEDKSRDMISWFPIFFPLKVRPLWCDRSS